MGIGLKFACKCGYTFRPSLGVGFMFPKVYQKAIALAREGKMGEELELFLRDHPDGALNVENTVVKCTSCGRYECVPDLSMYLPTGKKSMPKGIWCAAMPFENEEYVSPAELGTSYILYAPYQHKCRSCGGEMERIDKKTLEERGIECPECGRKLKSNGRIHWD